MNIEVSYIGLALVALLGATFFGGMEIIFATANKLKIELDKKQGVFTAGITSYFTQVPNMFNAAMLIGKQLVFFLFVFAWWKLVGESSLLSSEFKCIKICVTLILFLLVFISFVEFIPKALFAYRPNRWLNFFALPAALFYLLFFPLSLIISGVSLLIRKIFTASKKDDDEEADFGRVDLDEYLEQATGNIDRAKDLDDEIRIFRNALDFGNVKARDCLIPRNEIVAVEITDSISKLQKLFVETRLSKILVYRESIDHIIGYVHSFELFRKPENIQHVLRPISFIPEPMPANEILELLIKQKRNMVVVVDEFGGTAGIITMEDIVEEIFGEIDDEHDKPENTETVVSENVYEFSARLEIDYLNQKYELQLPVNNEEYDTLGGLILHLAGDIPEENLPIKTEDYLLTPLKVNEKMIELVRIEPRP